MRTVNISQQTSTNMANRVKKNEKFAVYHLQTAEPYRKENTMKNHLWLIILAGSAVRICLHFPECIIWILFTILMYTVFIRPVVRAVKGDYEYEENEDE